MKLEWTDKLFWPSTVGSGLGVLIVVPAAFGVEWVSDLVQPAEVILGSFAGLLFLVLLIDTDARRAVDAYNLNAPRWRDQSWRERLLPSGIDRRLMMLVWMAGLEIIALNWTGGRELALLPFLCAFLAAAMAMLMMKQTPPVLKVPGASRKTDRSVEFWVDMGGD